jgi:DNA polymerase-3 subunit gamma/tau
MAYTVLARRYRSSTFDEVVGQAHIAQTLKRAITSGRIAHAYLFCGTRGTGKTSMARILAKALNCLSSDGPTATPCGTCTSCVGIARGDDMDYIEIDAASNTQVEKTRDAIIDNVQFMPARCRFKIFLIDEVHMLSKASFNALLKTLEEPPEHVKFILATTEPEKILPTILSRCQRYDFRNIPAKEVAGHLRMICKDEGIAADEDALLLVARAGGGSMRDSLSLLDRLLSVGEKTLSVANIEQLLGLPPGERVSALVDALGTADAAAVLKNADEILSSGMSPDSLIAGLIDHLHNLLLLRVSHFKPDLVEAPGTKLETLIAQAKKIDTVLLTQDIALLEELKRQLRQGAGGRALMDATLVRLALAEQFRSITDLLAEVPADGGGAEKKKLELTAEAPQAFPTGALTRTIEQLKSPPSSPPAAPAEPTPPAAVAAQPTPPPQEPSQLATDNAELEDDDDLPRPGKVWDSTGPSLKELLAQEAAKNAPSPAQLATHNSQLETNVEAVDEAQLPAVWQRVLDHLKDSQGALYGLLSQTRLKSIENSQATLQLTPDQSFVSRQLENPMKRDKLSQALSAAFGQPLSLRISLDAARAPAAVAVAAEAKPRIARPTLKDIQSLADSAPALTTVAPPANTVTINDELLADLKKDDLVRAVLDGLKAQVVKVTEE